MRIKTATALLVATLAVAPGLQAEPGTLTGSIAGVVSNALGIPQMGATVTLFNHLDRQVAKLLTDDRGSFQFDSLPSDLYSLRITLASFMPATRNNIGVQPGIRRILAINLAGVLSSIELVYSLPIQQGLMADDWKWALRGSLATRPILRILAEDARDPLRHMRAGSTVFSHTRGMVRLSAGDATPAPTLGSQPDLGTAFAVATSLMGSNNLEFSGNFGYASSSGNPAAGFRTSYSRHKGEARTPEVAVTMRQAFLAGRGPGSIAGAQAQKGVPTLSTLSIGTSDSLQLTDNLHLMYGGSLETVQFLDRVSYFSPFAKAGYDFEELGVVTVGYSSGLPPTQLFAQTGSYLDPEQQQQLAYVALFPRVSVRGGRALVQRAQNYEISYAKTKGSRTFHAGVYRESLTNAALTAVGAGGAFGVGDMVSDMFSTASIFNAGDFQMNGFMASLEQSFGDDWSAMVGYGNSGVLETNGETLQTDQAQELRSMIETKNRHWVTTRVAGKAPGTLTRFTVSYQLMNGKALTPGHFYLTQRVNPQQGLNVFVRQPMPGFGMPGKLEATAELRNMLAQGYQGVLMPNGRRFHLVHSPRALRGGLAFIF
jgi:hypothetical protein